jgi:hypothetical protein
VLTALDTCRNVDLVVTGTVMSNPLDSSLRECVDEFFVETIQYRQPSAWEQDKGPLNLHADMVCGDIVPVNTDYAGKATAGS